LKEIQPTFSDHAHPETLSPVPALAISKIKNENRKDIKTLLI
jgi:hypothetical protein